jgi:molybdopterin molybdotransferase
MMVESQYPMLSPEQALQQVIEVVRPLPPVNLPIDEAVGHVLAAQVRATENMPPFPSSSMDGYAIIASDTAVERKVLGEQDAGHVGAHRVRPGTAVRIMTGAAVPEGADAVIPVELATEVNDCVRFSRLLPRGANIRPVGQDLAQGDVVLDPGTMLGAAEIGLLATMGHVEIAVYPRPRVAIMATGDELVPLGQTPGPGQIRDSNSHALAASIYQWGAVPVVIGIVHDEETTLRKAILDALSRADVLLTSGGVSMGRRDLMKPLLEELGRICFGRVAQKPGKPTTLAVVQGKPVFGLPGFPVSSLVSAELYVRPALRIMAGWGAKRRQDITVRLQHDIRHDPDRDEFQRAIVTWENGEAWARNTGDQVSGRLRSLVGANALMRLAQGVSEYHRGERVPALLLNAPEV